MIKLKNLSCFFTIGVFIATARLILIGLALFPSINMIYGQEPQNQQQQSNFNTSKIVMLTFGDT